MIRILTDSSSDITVEEAKELGITVIPLQVSFGEENFLAGINITNEEFYNKLETVSELPKTSQPSPAIFVDSFQKCIDDGDEVLGIFLSSGLSGTYQSSVLAAQMVGEEKIAIVDSKSASIGMAVLIRHAIKLKDEGKSIQEIKAELDELKDKVRIIAVMDTLKYLKMGGRLSSTAAAVGGVLGITPTIAVIDGLVDVIAKTRGQKKSIKFLMDYMAEHQVDKDYPIEYGFTKIVENVDKFKEKSKPEFGIEEVATRGIGPIIGTHIGPGAYGIAYIEK